MMHNSEQKEQKLLKEEILPLAFEHKFGLVTRGQSMGRNFPVQFQCELTVNIFHFEINPIHYTLSKTVPGHF